MFANGARIRWVALMSVLLVLWQPVAAQQTAPQPVSQAPPAEGQPLQPSPEQAAPAAPSQAQQTKPAEPAAAPQAQQGAAQSPSQPATAPSEAAAQPQAPAQTTPAASPQGAPGGPSIGGLNLRNVDLLEVVDFLARQLKINYVLDPAVQGSVTINTYGETRDIDARELLDTILRINGAAMVKSGDLYRIVPLAEVARLPLAPETKDKSKDIHDDDQAMLNLVFLKYITVDNLATLLNEFVGPSGRTWTYAPANLLLILDSRRNMRRLMELVALFDSDTFARQRVRLFEAKHARPSDLVKELQGILQSISLDEKNASVRFLPLDRINTIIAVAPNPGAFAEVENWLKKLDIEVPVSADSVNNYVYRVKYKDAGLLGASIMSLYGGFGGLGGYGGMGGYGAMGAYGAGAYGAYGAGMGGYGMGGYGVGGMMSPYATYGGAAGGPAQLYGMGGMGSGYLSGLGMVSPQAAVRPPSAQSPAGSEAGKDQTGTYLSSQQSYMAAGFMGPRIIPNIADNTLLIQATRQDYEQILKILRELDTPPRQILIDAKFFEVTLTGAMKNGLSWYLRERSSGGSPSLNSRRFQGSLASGAFSGSAGMLIGETRELVAFLSSSESEGVARVVSAPSLIATDGIPASINVGLEVPTLSSQAVTGIQQGGTSLFANTVANRATGLTLNITARVNPSGIVTLIINQQFSSPQAPSPDAAIQSPSFSNRTFQTQVTVQDGDTIAIGGIISENNGYSTAGVPVLHRLPIIGWAFGSKAIDRARTELIVLMTPRVIYDTNELVEASEEVKVRLKGLEKQLNQ